MDHHQSAREALNHLLATDTFLQGALVTDYDPRQSEGWNAARPFKDNQEENRRRARSMMANFNHNVQRVRDTKANSYSYWLKKYKGEADSFKAKLVEPLEHYGTPTLTGAPMYLTKSLWVRVGSIIRVGANISVMGQVVYFKVGQVEALNFTDCSASVRFNNGQLYQMRFINQNMANLHYDGRDFEVPVSHVVGANLEEAERQFDHDNRQDLLTTYLVNLSKKFMNLDRKEPFTDPRPGYKPTFTQPPFTGDMETYESEWERVHEVYDEFYRPGGILEKRIEQTRQKLDAALKAYQKELKN